MRKEENITEAEAALYDRQIRLWGLDAQRRLRAAKVLLAGLKGLGAEVAKNIVLAGINSITLLDDSQVDEEDKTSQFLVARSDVGKNRAECSVEKVQQLNPMVDVKSDSGSIKDKDEAFFKQFDVVCITCSASDTLCHINKICFENGIKFYAGDVFGYYGYMFCDLGVHEYAEEVPKKKPKACEDNSDGEPSPKKAKKEEMETVVVKKTLTYNRLENALNFDWSTEEAKKKLKQTPSTYFITQAILKFIETQGRRPLVASHKADQERLAAARDETLEKLKIDKKHVPENFSKFCFAELSPVCAVVGGVLGQEIIKAVSQKDQPHNNFFFFNGIDGSGTVDRIGS